MHSLCHIITSDSPWTAAQSFTESLRPQTCHQLMRPFCPTADCWRSQGFTRDCYHYYKLSFYCALKPSGTEHLQNHVSFSSRCRLSVPEHPRMAEKTAETAIWRLGKQRTWFSSPSAISLSPCLTETSLSSAWQHTDFVGDMACSARYITCQKSRGSALHTHTLH